MASGIALYSQINLNKEVDRLVSFANWPLDFIDVNMLARIGFYYTKCRYDEVRCWFCKSVFTSWVPGICPLQVHIRVSRNCPLFLGSSANVPLNVLEMDSLLCTARVLININRYKDIAIHPDQTLVKNRYTSFDFYDGGHMDQRLINSLVENGFFYERNTAKILCFCCSLLYQPTDYNFCIEQFHASCSRECEFVVIERRYKHIRTAIRTRLLSKIKSVKRITHKTRSTTQSRSRAQASGPGPITRSRTRTQISNQCPSNPGTVDHTQANTVKAECVICYDAHSEYIAMPCRHLLYCSNCRSVDVTECPICKVHIVCILRIFFP